MSGIDKGYQIPALSPDIAARSEGRRLITLRGGNREPKEAPLGEFAA